MWQWKTELNPAENRAPGVHPACIYLQDSAVLTVITVLRILCEVNFDSGSIM